MKFMFFLEQFDAGFVSDSNTDNTEKEWVFFQKKITLFLR